MAECIVIRLGGEPVAKGRPRIGRLHNGRPVAFTPAHTVKYETQLRYEAQHAMNGRPMFTGPLEMVVTAARPVPRSWSNVKKVKAVNGLIFPTSRPDGDNYLKIAADSLNQLVYEDDSQIVRMTVSKIYSSTPSLIIEVREVVPNSSLPDLKFPEPQLWVVTS